MRHGTWTWNQHESAAGALRRIRREARRLSLAFPTCREQDRAAKIETWADKVRHDLSTRAHKEGIDGLAIYYPREAVGGADALELLDLARGNLAEALDAIEKAGGPVDVRTVRALGFWLLRLTTEARRSADVDLGPGGREA